MTFLKFLTTKIFFKQILYAIAFLIVFSFITLWWLKSTTNNGQQIEVPELAKLTLDQVEDVLDNADLRYEILDSANYNPEYPKYSVIEQIPKAGKYVKEERKIYLTLNPSGYVKIKVPNVLNKTLRQAEPTLLAMGFTIGKISKIPHQSDQVQQLRYKGQTLTPGTELSKTATIDIIIGDGSLNRAQEINEEDNTQEQDDAN